MNFVLSGEVKVVMPKLEKLVGMAESHPVTSRLTMSLLSPTLTLGPREHFRTGAHNGENVLGSYLGSGPGFATN